MPPAPRRDAFRDVVHDLFTELHTLPYSTETILHFLTNDPNSPIVAEIQSLSLSWVDGDQMTSLLPAFRKLTSLTSLALSNCQLTPHHLKFLFSQCHALSKLKSLDLCDVNEVKSQELLHLSRSTTLTGLTSLSLTRCHLTSPRDTISSRRSSHPPVHNSRGLLALLSSPVLQGLTHLNLAEANIHDPNVYITIATSPFLTNLTSLDLGANWGLLEAIPALAASTTLSNITHLSLSDLDLDDEAIAELLSPPSLLGAKLQSIELSRTEMDTNTLYTLRTACPRLTELIVAENDRVGRRCAATAFLAKNMPKLTKLNLSYCMLSDEGYADLAASTKLTKLRELNLTGNQADPESIVALINSPTMANLTHLHIVGTHDGADILTAIAQSPSMAHLQHLSFKDNCAGDKAVIAFAKSTTLKSLTWLDLGNNEIGPKGAKALCTSRVVSQLKYLSLAENPDIGNSLATTLASPSSTLHNITELSLVDTGLDDEGALQLLATPNLRQLSHLLLLKENYDWMDEDDGMSDEELITGPVRTKYWARFNDCRY